MNSWKDGISLLYYLIGAVSFILVFIRLLYGWFRDYDNAQRFTSDMARVHLPYIQSCLRKIADRLDIELEQAPPVNFSRTDAARPQPLH